MKMIKIGKVKKIYIYAIVTVFLAVITASLYLLRHNLSSSTVNDIKHKVTRPPENCTQVPITQKEFSVKLYSYGPEYTCISISKRSTLRVVNFTDDTVTVTLGGDNGEVVNAKPDPSDSQYEGRVGTAFNQPVGRLLSEGQNTMFVSTYNSGPEWLKISQPAIWVY